MRKLNTYIIYYTDKNGYSDGFEAYGSEQLQDMLKWLHSDEIKAVSLTIYKQGKNFDNDKDDVVEVYKNLWK